MPVVHTLVSAIAFSLSLFATSLAFQPGALAQPQSDYQAQIAAFSPKLETARSTQADLNKRVTCLDQRDTDLVKQRAGLETRLGQLRTQEKSLAATLQTQQAAYNQYKINLGEEERKVAAIRKEIETMPGRERYERHKKNCASKNAYDRMACGRSMRYDWGRFDRIEADLNAARGREQTALGSMNAEKQNVAGSERQLTGTRGQITSTDLEIGQTEKAIASVKQALSDVRALVQPLRTLIDEFANALNEAKDINLADERPRTLRKLANIAAKVDSAVSSGANAASNTDKTLGPDWMKACVVR
jgi:predicted  nucleic acid-binding Zn-ribbon protein